jgi:hypothetical protein
MYEQLSLRELGDRWILPYRGRRVSQLRIDTRLCLLLEEGCEIAIEGEATLTQGSLHAPDAVPVLLVPQRQHVAPAIELFAKQVLSAVAFKSGTLRLVFDDGKHLNVRADPDYEAWTLAGPGAMKVVCMPGGSLAVWK